MKGARLARHLHPCGRGFFPHSGWFVFVPRIKGPTAQGHSTATSAFSFQASTHLTVHPPAHEAISRWKARWTTAPRRQLAYLVSTEPSMLPGVCLERLGKRNTRKNPAKVKESINKIIWIFLCRSAKNSPKESNSLF